MRPFALALTLTLSPLLSSAQEPKLSDYQLEMQVKIPMRDGVNLNATLYKPSPPSGKQPDKLPVIFMLSPYPSANSHPSGSYFARRGYVYAFVDVRGRGDSEGIFTPFGDDAKDGYDVVEWFARQPWSNGKVAMFGGSYAGGNQWQTASSHPPHLSTIVPVASVRAGIDFPKFQNLYDTYGLQWLTYTTGKTLYEEVFSDDGAWTGAGKRLFLAKAPFLQYDRFAGNTGTVFQTWLKHPDFDEYWKAMALTHDQVTAIDIPVLVLTGAHDGDQPGTLSFYDDYATGPNALKNYYLVMGPWDHPGTREPKADFSGEHFGPASLLDVLRLHREWYDFTMGSGTRPAFLQKHVAYYVAGSKAECWKYADSLATVSAKSLTLYLDATGGAASVYHSGTLSPTPAKATGATFLSDPNDLSAAEDHPHFQSGGDLHGDGLVFHSVPFNEDTEINGRMDLRLSLSIDAPDTDLDAELTLITPDGKTRDLTESVLRARYRNSLEHPEPIHEGRPEEYRFSPGNWFAVRAPKGSQLRLVLSALNNPFFEKNWNSIKPVAEQSGADAHIAHIQLLQTPEHPSTLTLPLGDPNAPCKASADW